MKNSVIYDISPFTLLDFPDRMACIVWFSGCNMRCPYCYNADIVHGKGNIALNDAYTFLEQRSTKLDGVVFSGGECTLHPLTLKKLLYHSKTLGYKTKIDTNGSRPEVLAQFIEEGLVDYVALDFKAPSYLSFEITSFKPSYSCFQKSLTLLMQSTPSFEVRTTVHQSILQKEDIKNMGDTLISSGYRGVWYLQSFQQSESTMSPLNDSPKIKLEEVNSLFSNSPLTIQTRNS